MHTTNYRSTLILPSPDSTASTATPPPKPGTVAAMQHERLAEAPYGLTSDDLIFGIHADRAEVDAAGRDAARADYFSKGQPCLRSSPLVRSYGWALHHDAEGRVALVDPADSTFAALTADPDVTKVYGMRSKRA